MAPNARPGPLERQVQIEFGFEIERRGAESCAGLASWWCTTKQAGTVLNRIRDRGTARPILDGDVLVLSGTVESALSPWTRINRKRIAVLYRYDRRIFMLRS